MKRNRIKTNDKVKNVVLLVLVIIAINSIFFNTQSYSKVEIEYKTKLISSGDTLWSIAKKESIKNKYYQQKDIREIVYDLKQVNNLQESNLSVGQTIKIPDLKT